MGRSAERTPPACWTFQRPPSRSLRALPSPSSPGREEPSTHPPGRTRSYPGPIGSVVSAPGQTHSKAVLLFLPYI
ncbi:MAG: hypothetical protein AMJ94_15895 [Deltaproteobacteria bacterium SM23_61]|nr:MAG: hypothetical protein AMJ94_15895 [Deltaproteobacteria bacterium SM23_61]